LYIDEIVFEIEVRDQSAIEEIPASSIIFPGILETPPIISVIDLGGILPCNKEVTSQ
jgi:hypothetical protein